MAFTPGKLFFGNCKYERKTFQKEKLLLRNYRKNCHWMSRDASIVTVSRCHNNIVDSILEKQVIVVFVNRTITVQNRTVALYNENMVKMLLRRANNYCCQRWSMVCIYNKRSNWQAGHFNDITLTKSFLSFCLFLFKSFSYNFLTQHQDKIYEKQLTFYKNTSYTLNQS